MKILVIGSGGREHALALKIKESPLVETLFVAPGNAGTQKIAQNIDLDVMDFDGITAFCLKEMIDLVVIGPENPLCAGLSDHLQHAGIRVFGVNKEGAQFEGSKHFTKEFLVRHQIPTAAYAEFTDYQSAITYAKEQSYPLVIKADGLALGKGVHIVHDFDQASAVLRQMLVEESLGESGSKVVIEEFLVGEELSLICFVSNNKLFPLQTARDYKRAKDYDEGENTGGVGCYSPLQLDDEQLQQSIDQIVKQISQGLMKDGYEFTGILFIGFMYDNFNASVLEFNVRFGDPETQLLLPRLESDIVELMQKALDGTLTQEDFKWSDDVTCGVVMYADGYPGTDFKRMTPINNLPKDSDELWVIHNGTVTQEGQLYANGGRVLTVIAKQSTLEKARQLAYKGVKQIQSENLVYRKDIGLNENK